MYVIFLLSVAALVFIDQYTKYLAITKLKPISDYPLIKNIFHLTYVENRGAAFGILQNRRTLFVIITCVVVIAITIYYFKLPRLKMYNWHRISLILLISGAIGNLIDRVRLSYVVDFLYFKLINFPVFNFADICVVVAVGIIFVITLFGNEANIL